MCSCEINLRDHLERPRRRWEDIIKMYLQEVRWGSMAWIDLAQYTDRWRALVTTAIKFGFS
jgi:hypothetical protein